MSVTLQRVSVVIPTYNYGHFVAEAVESALKQTYPNLEVIVVDDGSNDDTAERLRQFGNQIIYIYQQNKGLSSARNAGIRRATGEWVAFLDADDVWHAEKIAKQLAAVGGDHDIGLIGSPPAAVLPDKLPGHAGREESRGAGFPDLEQNWTLGNTDSARLLQCGRFF